MGQFFSEQSDTPWFGSSGGVFWFHCCFDVAQFNDQVYLEHGVKQPATLFKAVVKRRAEFLAGRHCAQKALTAAGYREVNVGIGNKRNPLWPEKVLGAISHSQHRAVAVVSNNVRLSGIGIDIEQVIDQQRATNLEPQVLSAAEIDLFTSYQHSRALLFSLAFSAKESFFKAAFPQVQNYFGFDAVEINQVDFSAQTLDFTVIKSPHTAFPKGMGCRAFYTHLSGNMIATYIEI